MRGSALRPPWAGARGGVRIWWACRRRAVLRGAAVWAVLAAPVVAGLPEGRAAAAVQLAGLVVLAGALAAGRWPLPVLVAVFALPLAGGNFVFSLPVVGYRVGRYSPRTRPVVWAYTLICAGGALINTARGTPVPRPPPPGRARRPVTADRTTRTATRPEASTHAEHTATRANADGPAPEGEPGRPPSSHRRHMAAPSRSTAAATAA